MNKQIKYIKSALHEPDQSFIQFSVQRYEFYVEQTQKEAWNMKCFYFFYHNTYHKKKMTKILCHLIEFFMRASTFEVLTLWLK